MNLYFFFIFLCLNLMTLILVFGLLLPALPLILWSFALATGMESLGSVAGTLSVAQSYL